jgi:UDPglucose--hexose-1-phosphate uridylyltransferase
VVFAPGRGGRPGAWLPAIEPATLEELESCPFCAGREDRTPPETLRLGDPWRVRVVPNLYPAFARHEVVVHAPEHVRSLAELDDGQVALVAEAWERRRAAEPGGMMVAIINEGRFAGASLPHSHSQLVWPTELEPEKVDRLPELIARDDLTVGERAGIVATLHPVGGSPYESLIAPSNSSLLDPEALANGLILLRDLVRKLHAAEGPRPWNAWLHPGERWHLHFVPRLTALAGIELGAGISVNVLPPDRAAAELRRSTD